jgi:succinate dehydrogenase / fumarate reductase iron-sulfur subunit
VVRDFIDVQPFKKTEEIHEKMLLQNKVRAYYDCNGMKCVKISHRRNLTSYFYGAFRTTFLHILKQSILSFLEEEIIQEGELKMVTTTEKKIHLIIERQNDSNSEPYKEEFLIPYRPNMNIISALMYIRENPVNKDGEKTIPIQWEMSCLEEVCGICSMVINGTPLQACSTLVDKIEHPIRIEPMRTFPVVRDLIIDRENMFNSLRQVKAWIPIDGTHDIGPGPRMNEKKRLMAYELSKCFTCGVCQEACPNVNDKSDFMGPFVFSQVRLKNVHPTGEMNRGERIEAFMEEGGLQGCGNSQNCVQVCPKGIPITTSIAAINREATLQSFKSFLGSDNY